MATTLNATEAVDLLSGVAETTLRAIPKALAAGELDSVLKLFQILGSAVQALGVIGGADGKSS